MNKCASQIVSAHGARDSGHSPLSFRPEASGPNPQSGGEDREVSLKEAAAILGASYSFVYEHVKSGEIRAYRLSKWVVPVSALMEFKDRRSNQHRKVSESRFREIQSRLRSLKTEAEPVPIIPIRKGEG